jgi:hypothetical protein
MPTVKPPSVLPHDLIVDAAKVVDVRTIRPCLNPTGRGLLARPRTKKASPLEREGFFDSARLDRPCVQHRRSEFSSCSGGIEPVSVQISSPPAPGQGVGAIGVRAPVANDPMRRPGQSTARPFAALPHDLIADKRLKATDVRLAGVILRYARAKPSCWPSVKTLADDLGKCERTVQYALRRLADAGWITQKPDPNPTGRLLVLAWREPRCTPPGATTVLAGAPQDECRCTRIETGRRKRRVGSRQSAEEGPRTADDARRAAGAVHRDRLAGPPVG